MPSFGISQNLQLNFNSFRKSTDLCVGYPPHIHPIMVSLSLLLPPMSPLAWLLLLPPLPGNIAAELDISEGAALIVGFEEAGRGAGAVAVGMMEGCGNRSACRRTPGR